MEIYYGLILSHASELAPGHIASDLGLGVKLA